MSFISQIIVNSFISASSILNAYPVLSAQAPYRESLKTARFPNPYKCPVLSDSVAQGYLLLIGLGFTLLYGILKFFNVSLGAIAVLGGYVTLFFMEMGFGLWMSIVGGLFVSAGFGYVLEKVLYLPLRRKKATVLHLFIASLGVSIVIEAVLAIFFSSDIRLLVDFLPDFPVIRLFNASISYVQIFMIVSSLILFFFTALVLKRTSFGRAVRAISDDEEVARIVGIRTEKFMVVVSCFVCFLAGWAGIANGFDIGLQPILGSSLFLFGMVAAITGGLGNIYGALLGSIVLGLIVNFAALILPGEWRITIAFVVFIVVLLFRPRGLIQA